MYRAGAVAFMETAPFAAIGTAEPDPACRALMLAIYELLMDERCRWWDGGRAGESEYREWPMFKDTIERERLASRSQHA